MVTSTATATVTATASSARHTAGVCVPRAHEMLAEALTIRSHGGADSVVIGNLKRRGLTDHDALKVFAAIDRQLGHSRTVTRRVRSLVVASVVVQLLLALTMTSLNIAAAPIPVLIGLAIVARVCRADEVMARQLSRRRHLFG